MPRGCRIRDRALAYLAAWNTGLNGDLVSDFHVLNAWANCDDDTARLVAEGSLVSDGPWSQTSVLPEVNVTSANTASAKEQDGIGGVRREMSRLSLRHSRALTQWP